MPLHQVPGTAPARPVTSRLPALVAAVLLFLFALYQGLATNNTRDFFIYRLGAELAVHGESPYDVPKIQQRVAAAFSVDDADTKEFVANCGYFLPPQAIVLFLPLAVLPTLAAKICWAALLGLSAYGIARIPGLLQSADSPPPARIARTLIPFVLVLNPLVLSIVVVGQVTVLCVGCIAAGLWCLGRGRPYLTSLFWTVPFVKPHLTLALIPLTWFLGGWRTALVLVGLVALLNVIGATIVGGTPLFLGDYLEALSTAHKTVGYNRVELNSRITSWNCLLYRSGGPLIELSALTTLAGYLIWFGLVVGRAALASMRPSTSWAVAAAAVGAVLCSQVLVYELLILVLVTPWVRRPLRAGSALVGVARDRTSCRAVDPASRIGTPGPFVPAVARRCASGDVGACGTV